MKKINILILSLLLSVSSLMAQTPNAINFQAIARDQTGSVLENTNIQIRLTIIDSVTGGSEIYQELRALSTNNFGSFSFQIGQGADYVTLGAFLDVQWETGEKYLKIDYDPTNTFDWSLSLGTLELISVPYALHAKTAETITGTITELDPVYEGSQASNITITDIDNLSNLSGVNTGDQNLDAYATTTNVNNALAGKVNAESGKDLLIDGTTEGEMLYWDGSNWVNVIPGSNGETLTYCDGVPTWGDCPLLIGDALQGGLVAYILQDGDPGYVENEVHGLIISEDNLNYQGTNPWGEYILITGTSTSFGSGNSNTAQIVSALSGGAAHTCNDYSAGGYTDWYLPSKDELLKIYLPENQVPLSLSLAFPYWSSSEINEEEAWYVATQAQGGAGIGNKMQDCILRAVRSF